MYVSKVLIIFMKKTKKKIHFILNIELEFTCGHCGTVNQKRVLCRLKNQGTIPPHIIKGVNTIQWHCKDCGTSNHAQRVVYGPLTAC